jgi:hypothetical protein
MSSTKLIVGRPAYMLQSCCIVNRFLQLMATQYAAGDLVVMLYYRLIAWLLLMHFDCMESAKDIALCKRYSVAVLL